MLTGGGGCGVNSPSNDFTAPSVEPMFRQPMCFCGCCNIHHNSTRSGSKIVNGGMSGVSGQRPQVLTFPEAKTPISGFNESRRINVTTSNATTWKADFQCPSHASCKGSEKQQQPMDQMPQQRCCFPPFMGGGNVEIVKVGEGPPLTLADLQRHGAFPFPDGDEWPAHMHPQRASSVQQSSHIAVQECPTWRPITIPECKRTPISEYSNWSQRKKSAQQMQDLQHDFMIHQPSSPPAAQGTPKPMVSESGCFCDQGKLVTTTAQTENPVFHQPHHYPMLMTPHACNQCTCGGPPFNPEPWKAASDANGEMQFGPVLEVQQKKFSLPPASHHSPEQRTSYRAKRIY
ncbi:unnamed protein product [Hydatigera taeniaeformis]|uniref:Protein FAM13A n=1 Tax=Hydatigena taeniaeformis TaxID=6205 RepID=A0A0R3X900_HYDTA|nr:unnamed protein product [Hydatigera taeniaeformis]